MGATRNSGPFYPDQADERARNRWMNLFVNLRLLEDATAKTLERFVSAVRFESWNAADRIASHDDAAGVVYFLLEGTVRGFQESGDGLEYTPKIFRAPSHFGDLAALGGLTHYHACLESLTSSVTASVPITVLERCLAEDHGLCRSWLYSTARQHVISIDYTRQNMFGGLLGRLGNVLLSYAEALGSDAKGRRRIEHELSYNTIARQAACSRRTAITAMQNLTQSGLVERSSEGWAIDANRISAELLPGRMSLTHSLDDNRKPALVGSDD